MNDLELFAMQHSIKIEDVEYLTRNGISVRCKCGNFKALAISKQSKIGMYIYRTCKSSKCEPNYGKLRPAHSDRMKHLAKNGSDSYKATLMSPGKKHNASVNTIEFKRIRLSNSGIDTTTMNDSEVLQSYSKLLSTVSKSISTRKVQILNRFKKWEPIYVQLILDHVGQDITLDYLNSLSDDEIQALWKFTHGINTLRNASKLKSSKQSWFKQELLSGPFKYNTQRDIFIKSGLERKYVDFFESNGIEWVYEPVHIKTNVNSFYVPDFLIRINDEYILLEVKGSFYRRNIQEYLSTKISAGIDYAKSNGYRFVLTFKDPDIDYGFITNSFINLK
jgi:hypothetical protein